MGVSPLISICIPAYQRKEYLKRLLDSIEIQTFRLFEVIITDDSPDTQLLELVENHPLMPMIRYYKNLRTLGTPENWNEGLGKSKGEWIKIMHDDDWFSHPESLNFFVKAIEKGGAEFYFSAYTNVALDGYAKSIRPDLRQLKLIKQMPESLFASNRIGPPSVVIFKKDTELIFDKRMKWLVDIDFYIRYLKKHGAPEYIPKNLVQIGISESQVTHTSFGKPEIEIPERFMLGEKLGDYSIQYITVFDAWWRFLRNLAIRDTDQIKNSGYCGKIPDFIPSIIKFQNKIPASILKIGLFSKTFMFISYLKIRKNLKLINSVNGQRSTIK
jgi:glycosyltransferase involved in cell wall biosynthesis